MSRFADPRDVVNAMQREVLRDIIEGRVPADVASFSALHDHVDANLYARHMMPGDLDARAALFNACSDAVDAWLKAERPSTPLVLGHFRRLAERAKGHGRLEWGSEEHIDAENDFWTALTAFGIDVDRGDLDSEDERAALRALHAEGGAGSWFGGWCLKATDEERMDEAMTRLGRIADAVGFALAENHAHAPDERDAFDDDCCALCGVTFCFDCGKPVEWDEREQRYFHLDPEARCFLHSLTRAEHAAASA